MVTTVSIFIPEPIKKFSFFCLYMIPLEKIGKLVGDKLVTKILIKQLNQDPKLIHAIGHSLGAHLVGHIGRAVENRTGNKHY